MMFYPEFLVNKGLFFFPQRSQFSARIDLLKKDYFSSSDIASQEQCFVVNVLHLDHSAVISYPLFVFSIHQSLLTFFLFGQIA